MKGGCGSTQGFLFSYDKQQRSIIGLGLFDEPLVLGENEIVYWVKYKLLQLSDGSSSFGNKFGQLSQGKPEFSNSVKELNLHRIKPTLCPPLCPFNHNVEHLGPPRFLR
jgi:hypothetical protein